MKALKDANLLTTLALANGAATVTSTGIDTGETTALGNVPEKLEFELDAPALTVGQLPNGHTVTYNIIWADSADLQTNPVTYIPGALVQTGAGGTGAAAATFRFKVPSTSERYVGFSATNSGADNISGSNATLQGVL